MIVYAIFRDNILYEVQTGLTYAKHRREHLDLSLFGLFTIKPMRLEEIEQ